MLDRPISDLNLSVRARKCMVRLGLTTIGELVRKTGDDLLECKNFGVTSLNEVRDKLTQYSLEAPRRLKPPRCSTFRAAAMSMPAVRARGGASSRRPHGPVDTPAFMPVGTQGTVKGLTVDLLRATRHADGAGQHLSPGAAPRRGRGPRPGRAAPLHGLGRARS